MFSVSQQMRFNTNSFTTSWSTTWPIRTQETATHFIISCNYKITISELIQAHTRDLIINQRFPIKLQEKLSQASYGVMQGKGLLSLMPAIVCQHIW